jgi:hypothetical protein
MGVGGQSNAPDFTPGKETRYSLHRRLGGPQGQSGWVQKILPPPGFDPQTIQPIASQRVNVTIIKSKYFQIIISHYMNMESRPFP